MKTRCRPSFSLCTAGCFFLVMMLVFPSTTSGQNNITDIDTVVRWTDLVYENFHNKNYDSVLYWGERIMQECSKDSFPTEYSYAAYLCALVYHRDKKDVVKARNLLQETIFSIFSPDKDVRAMMLVLLCEIENDLMNYRKSIRYGKTAYVLITANNLDPMSKFLLGNYLYESYMALDDTANAVEQIHSSIEGADSFEPIIAHYIKTQSRLNLAYIQENDSLIDHYSRELANIVLPEDNIFINMPARIMVGLAYSNAGKSSLAIEYLLEGRRRAMEANDSTNLVEIDYGLALSYKDLGEYEKAIEYATMADKLAEKAELTNFRIHLIEILTTAYKETNQPWKALENFDLYTDLVIEAWSVDQAIELAQQEDVFYQKVKEEEKKEQTAFAKRMRKQNQFWAVGFFVVLVLVGLVAGQGIQINAQRKKLALLNQELKQARDTLASRVAVLNDSYVVKLWHRITNFFNSGHKEIVERLDESDRATINEAVGYFTAENEMIFAEYKPGKVVLQQALLHHLNNVIGPHRATKEIFLRIPRSDLMLQDSLCRSIYEIMGELTRNSIKHAFKDRYNDNSIRVTITENDTGFLLTYSDNGPEISASAFDKENWSIGMEEIVEKVEKTNGTIDFTFGEGLTAHLNFVTNG